MPVLWGLSMLPDSRSVPLRRRLFLLASAGIVPLAVMAGVALYAEFQQQREQAERATLEIARALATATDAELSRTISVLEALATSPQLDSSDVAAFESRMQRVAAMQPHWRGISLSTPDGRQVVNSQYPGERARRQIAEAASFEETLLKGKPTVGYIFRRASSGGFSIPIRVPVMRDGKLAYVLSAPIKPEAIVDIVRRQRLEEGWVITIVDSRGIRVMRWPRQEEYVGTPVSGTLQKLMAGGAREGTGITTTSEGHTVYTAYSRSSQSGWAVALGVPRDQVEAAAWRSSAVLGSGILLSLALGAIAALAIARSINRPMAELRAAAQAADSDAHPPPVRTSIREIREVSQALELGSRQRAAAMAERETLLLREQSARATAEAANRAKDEFLAMLGHELRNPLGAASNAATVLERSGSDEGARRQAIAVILRQVRHLARLTDDLLDAGRALMGKIVLQRESVNVAAAAQQSIATLRATGRLDRHRVIEQMDGVWASVDPIRLDQVFSNLLVNAAKYTPAPGEIRVSVGREGGEAVIRVADNGIGLSPELAARAFDLFVQGDRELDRTEGGLGIGLTLVRRLAELHGGSASVVSGGSGKGSEFTVRFPAIEPPAQPATRALPQAAIHRRILLVEDNEDARDTMQMLLTMIGHEVDVAHDGPSGLEALLRDSPEVALVDIGLPGMDGYEVARRARAAGGPHRPYLVALTGYGSPQDRERALAAGFDAHLVKPVDPDVLQPLLVHLPRDAAVEAGRA
jgi:signal transduction histidine kinase/ActR/RegA family two-component response regulator